MNSKLLLPGIEAEDDETEAGMERFVKVELKTVRVVDPISRSAGDAAFTPMPDDVNNDDIVELDFEADGRVWKQWMTIDQLHEISQRRVSRGVEPDKAQVFIPHTWEAKDTSRGLGTVALKALKIFGIDTPEKVAEKSAQKMAAAIAAHFESQIEKQGHTFGLYRLNDPLKIEAKNIIRDAKKLNGNGPYLIFIHGAASSGVGSFNKLAETTEWKELLERYPDRILALEHRTFSVSPIQNALDLADLLPEGARLHLVTHSRGGLVGELMCLAQAGDSRSKFDQLARLFEQKITDDDGLKAERERQRKDLEKLWDLLMQKKIFVDRFARVACPARGTTLASKRMDYLASGLLNAVGLIPGIKGNPAIEIGYDWLKSLLLTLIKVKADPRELPGIEAMIPDSPLIEFLNHKDLSTQADLGVIAGDIEVGNLKLAIPALIGNAFFWAKNDLVVNTKAMYEGIRRKQAYYFFSQGATVCHFNYFYNQETRVKLKEWLLREDQALAENFREVQRELSDTRGVTTISDWLEKEEPVVVGGPVYSLQVSVSHGDLRRARYPVAVGHYDGDGIVSAEKYIDRLLGGRLADRWSMGLYPGPVGTAEVIYGPKGSLPRGALVIGLGDVGEISSEVVKQGVTTAALRYALSLAERTGTKPNVKYRSAAISSLLIGTYGGSALLVKDSVAAILQGVMSANRVLYLLGIWDSVRIDKVEFVEIYEDIAIQTAHAIHKLSQGKSFDFADEVTIKVDPEILRPVGGGLNQRPVSEFEAYWYSRIQISGVKSGAQLDEVAAMTHLPTIFGLDSNRQITQRYFIDKLIEEAMKTPKKRAQLSEVITELLTQDRNKVSRNDGLEFLVLTDRARVEASLQVTQRRLVDLLVEQSINKTQYDRDLSISLFELLIPNDLKNRRENVVLLVDRESAQYPWELVTDRTLPDEPLATRMGILRQFRTADFRANPRPSRGNFALVVGDPRNTGLASLPGAQDEAEAVAGLLKKNGYNVGKLINDDGKVIINELFSREYQVLHIAAHGTYNPSNPDQSGVVLGDGLFLTAKELINLRTVPDLVFINCCHLGKVDRDDTPKLETDYPQRLAASVAEELIKMGVKAVVAAGWAVDDAAAKKFAQEFYGLMLEGEAFGRTVLKARHATHKDHGGTNTWGAYQCYGNPNFRLNLQGGAPRKKLGLYSRREYRDELRSIAEKQGLQGERSNKEDRDRLIELEKALRNKTLPGNLLADGEVLTDFGDAWYAMGSFQDAIHFYEKAIHTHDARAQIRAVERLANMKCRYAMQLLDTQQERTGVTKTTTQGKTGGASPQIKEIHGMLEEAKKHFDWLLSLEPTSERYALIGKVFKCFAIVAETKADRETHLRKAKEFYRKGRDVARKNNESPQNWLYPATNYIACSLLLPGSKKSELTSLIKESQKVWEKAMEDHNDPNFWIFIFKPDLKLLQHLVDGDLDKHHADVIDAYKEAFAKGVKPNEAESVLGQLKFMMAMLNANGQPGQKAGLGKALSMVKSELSSLITS